MTLSTTMAPMFAFFFGCFRINCRHCRMLVFSTDAANALGLYQKKCLSRSDNVTKLSEVKLEVFANYTRKGCILECHANRFYEKCGCLPYHYPDFSAVWNKPTNCNHTGLQCISKLVGKNYCQGHNFKKIIDVAQK